MTGEIFAVGGSDSLRSPQQMRAIAAGVLYPAFGLLLNPIIVSAAMGLSSVSVIANALRLLRVSL